MEKLYPEQKGLIAETLQVRKRIADLQSKEKIYKSIFDTDKIPLTLTFNDVLMVPQYGEIDSR